MKKLITLLFLMIIVQYVNSTNNLEKAYYKLKDSIIIINNEILSISSKDFEDYDEVFSDALIKAGEKFNAIKTTTIIQGVKRLELSIKRGIIIDELRPIYENNIRGMMYVKKSLFIKYLWNIEEITRFYSEVNIDLWEE